MNQQVFMVFLGLCICAAAVAFASSDSALSQFPQTSVDFVHTERSIEASKKCACPEGCSLLKFMKKKMNKVIASGDPIKLAKAFHHIKAKPIPGYSQWRRLASEGAKHAEAGDLDLAKKVCSECHKLYRKKYRKDKALRCNW